MQWRGKILFAMILYAAGFLTAIYLLAPSDRQTAGNRNGQFGRNPDETTEWAWATSVRAGMSTAVSFAEEQALQLTETIKTRMAQTASDNRGD